MAIILIYSGWFLLTWRIPLSIIVIPLFLAIVFAVPIYFFSTFLSTFIHEGLGVLIASAIIGLFVILVASQRIPVYLNIGLMAQTCIETGIIPWSLAAALLSVGGLFLLASIKVIESKEY